MAQLGRAAGFGTRWKFTGFGIVLQRKLNVIQDFTRRGVAQPGRAPGSGPGGRRFKSSLPDHSFQFFTRTTHRPSGNGPGDRVLQDRINAQIVQFSACEGCLKIVYKHT